MLERAVHFERIGGRDLREWAVLECQPLEDDEDLKPVTEPIQIRALRIYPESS
jgi:hypothetical protein